MMGRFQDHLVCAAALATGLCVGLLLRVKLPEGSAAKTAMQLSSSANPGPRLIDPFPASRKISEAEGSGPSNLGYLSHPAALRPLSHRDVLVLADRCAPSEPAKILVSIARVESAYHPLKIGVNGPIHRSYEPQSKEEAIELAQKLISSGYNIDLGMAQINVNNLPWLKLSLVDAFDPCQNLKAAAAVITRGYRLALKSAPSGQAILATAYSLYNTGKFSQGMTNGYVERIENASSN